MIAGFNKHFLTNSNTIQEMLQPGRCGYGHARCGTKWKEDSSDELCMNLLKAVSIVTQRRQEEEIGLFNLEGYGDMCEEEFDLEQWKCDKPQKGDRDEITGAPLDPKLVRQGVKEELGFMRQHEVWTKMLRADVLRQNPQAKIIKARWVKTQKSDSVRCRLVAMEFADEKRDDLFAGTPPLAAMRLLLSSAMSKGRASYQQKVTVVDVKRAFLYGRMEREVYVELTPEDPSYDGGLSVGKLHRSLYGTRDAPLAWQRLVRKFMEERGFKASRVCTSILCRSFE